jgi:hypothetical protein
MAWKASWKYSKDIEGDIMNEEEKQKQAHEDMEHILDPVGSFEQFAEEYEKYCGGPPDKESIYDIMDDIARNKIDDLVDETAKLPEEPINSWEQ